MCLGYHSRSFLACLIAWPLLCSAAIAPSNTSRAAVAADGGDGDTVALLQVALAQRGAAGGRAASSPPVPLAASRSEQASSGVPPWPSGRGPAGHYGWSASLTAPFDLKPAWTWQHPAGRFHTLTYGTAIDEGGNIYLSGADAIRKFSSQGKLMWEYNSLPAELPNAACLADGRVYSSDTHGRVFAVSMETGRLLWENKACEEIGQDNGFVTVHDGVVVAATDGNLGEKNLAVRAFDARNGTLRWTFWPDANVWNFMASFPGDGTLVFQDQSGKGYGLQLHDGKLLWSAGGFPGSWTDATASLGANGVLYTMFNSYSHELDPHRADTPGTLCARNATDGTELWSRITPRPPNNAAAVGRVYGHEGLTVVQPIGHQALQGAPTDVYAYDATTGATRWVFKGPAQRGLLQAGDMQGLMFRQLAGVRAVCLPNPWSAPTIDASGTVFVGNQDGLFFALRDLNSDGIVEGPGEVSSFDTQAAFSGSAGPSLAPGRVVVASCDSLFVFDG